MSDSATQYRRSGNFWGGGVVRDEYSIIQDDDGNWYRYIGIRPKPFNVSPGVRPNAENWINVGSLIESGPSNAIEGESFTDGGTVDNIKEFIIDEVTGLWYYWTGAFPKEVPPNSSPATTGGIGDGKWKLLNGTGSADTSNLLSKDDNLDSVVDKQAALRNLKGAYKPDIDGLATFADLRTRAPAYAGERIYIKCHTPPALSTFLPEGGGWFIGRMTAQADDKGYIASAGGAWHWQRDKPIDQLTIADFGGVADGQTDASPAFKAILEFYNGAYALAKTNNLSRGFSIRFGAGTYYMTPGVYNKYGSKLAADSTLNKINPSGYTADYGFRMEGVIVGTMKMVATRIISDKSDNPVFLMNHRRMHIHGIIWDGQQTVAMNLYNADTNPTGTNMLQGATMGVFNDTASNKQPFLKNECPGGLYARVSCFNAVNTGNYTFYILDTLDSVFEQIFGQRTAGPVIQVGWSDPLNEFYGKWDHSTSLEIKNSNFLSNMSPTIWAPRCAQAVLSNVWWSGPGTTPFDLNNGQWTMTMLVVEGCRHDPILWNCKDTIFTYSAATGNSLSRSSPTSGDWWSYLKNPDGSDITGWNNTYDMGNFLLQNYGAYFDCPVVTKWDRGILRGTNNTDSTLWVNVGRFRSLTNGTSWRIRVLGGRFYNTESIQNVISDSTYGQTIINIGKSTTTTPKATWYSEGSGPVQANPQWKTQPFVSDIPEVWVPIRSRCAEFTIFVESTGQTRSETGQPSMFDPSGATQTTNPGLNQMEGRFSLHTGQAGIGAKGDVAAITSKKVASVNGALSASEKPVVATDAQWLNEPVNPQPVSWMRVNVAGQELALPVYAWKPVFTTSNPATLSVATGATLTLTTVVTDAVSYQWQKSTDGGTNWTSISGATSAVFTKTGVTTDDAGQYRLVVRSNNGTGGNGINSYGPVTTVTVT